MSKLLTTLCFLHFFIKNVIYTKRRNQILYTLNNALLLTNLPESRISFRIKKVRCDFF